MTSSEILLFVKEEVAKHGDGKPSSLVIQAIREACLNLVSSKAAEATPSCICATNCHFDCEDKLCKCPHHLTATEAPGGQGVSGMSEDMKAHRRKAFAPDEVEAIEKEHEHSWLKKQAELEDNANCCIGCPPTEADFKALAAPADDGMYEACAKVRELHTRSLSSGTGKIIICMCSICETFKAWQKSNHLTAAEAPGGQREFEGCSCGSHDLAPLYHHPKCALAHAAPSERADELRVALLAGADEADQWRENGIKGGAVEWRIGLEVLANKLRTWSHLRRESEMSHKTKLTVASSAILDVFLDESVPRTEVNDSLIELREEIDLKIAEIQAKCLRGSSQEGK